MKVSNELVGQVVTIQLARPLYIIDYASHVKFSEDDQQLIGEPMLQGTREEPRPAAMDILIGVTVREVTDDSVTVELLTPKSNLSLITVPSALIIQIAQITKHQPTELPTVTKYQAAEPSRIIAP